MSRNVRQDCDGTVAKYLVRNARTHQIGFRFWPRFLIPRAVISLATLTVVGLALAASSSSASRRREHGSGRIER
jgi:hypothetical protein